MFRFLFLLIIICKQFLINRTVSYSRDSYNAEFEVKKEFNKNEPEWHHHLYQVPKKETLPADPTFSPTSPSSPFPILNKQVIWFCFAIKKNKWNSISIEYSEVSTVWIFNNLFVFFCSRGKSNDLYKLD